MRYIIRAIKYFVYVSLLLAAVLGILMLTGIISTDIHMVFKSGWESVGWIALMFAGVSAVYPRFGYSQRKLTLPGAYAELKPGIVEYMAGRGYILEKEEGETLSFRIASVPGRIAKQYEDRITFTRDFGGFQIEGLNRDVVRILYGLENKFNDNG